MMLIGEILSNYKNKKYQYILYKDILFKEIGMTDFLKDSIPFSILDRS